MNAMKAIVLVLGFVLAVPSMSQAQILVAKDGPVVYGHHHLNTTNMEAQKKFFVDTLGGKLVKIGANNQEIIEFPNVLIFFRPMQAPTGGTIGTTVNHIGFSVPDLRPVVAKIKANGFKMITTDSVAATVKVTDDIAAASPTTNHRVRAGTGRREGRARRSEGTDDADPAAPRPLLRPAEHRDAGVVREDVRCEAAPPNPAPPSCTDQLPGVALNFSPSPTPIVGTRAARSITSASRSRTSKRSPRSWKRTASSWTVPYTQGAGARHRHRVHQGSVGHEHRDDRRARRGPLNYKKRISHKRHKRHIKAAFMCLLCLFVVNPAS